MNIRSPFLALVKLELTRSSTIYGNPIAWFLMAALVAVNISPALMLRFQPDNPLYLLGQETWASMMMMWWLWYLIAECSNSLVRGVWGFLALLGIPATYDWHEFLGTRAIDRTLHFRAKTAMLVAFVVLPMLLNFVLICAVTRQFPPGIGAFVEATPASQFVDASVATTTAFAMAMVWAGAAAIVLAQGYYGLVSRLLTDRRTIRGAVMACLPVLFAVAGFAVFQVSFESERDRIAPTVRFFARHWFELTLALLAFAFVVQRFCERRFAEQEVL
jgi:hypothetical protein